MLGGPGAPVAQVRRWPECAGGPGAPVAPGPQVAEHFRIELPSSTREPWVT